MKRLYSIDFLKLIFAYVIAYFHFGHTIAPGPTVTVQIFFFISGFFLAKKFYGRTESDSAWDYTLNRVKGLFPPYLLAYAAYLLYDTVRAVVEFLKSPSFQIIQQTLLSYYDQISNLLFLQSAYYLHDKLNYPLWQLSALVISGYFVYGMLCCNEKLSRQLLFPAAILMVMSLRHTGIDLFANYGFFYMPLLRAFAGLSYGVLIYYFTTTDYYGWLKEKKTAYNLAVLLSLVCVFVYGEHGNIHFITAALVILGCYDGASWINKLLNNRAFRGCGKFSLSVYLNHALVCRFTNGWLFPHLSSWGFTLNQLQKDLIYFVLLTVCSAGALYLLSLFVKRKRPLAAMDATH